MRLNMIFLYVLFLFFPFCIADGVHEANVGKINWILGVGITTPIWNGISLNDKNHGWQEQYESNTNTELLSGNIIGSEFLPHTNDGGFKLNGAFKIDVANRPLASWFSLNFDFVVIPFRDGVQISSPDFTASRLPLSENPTPKMNYSFNMVFTDPTLATAESHVYSIEFWDCLNGQCKLDEYSKKTVKRGEAIITVNYTP